jgi:hypothetical protein
LGEEAGKGKGREEKRWRTIISLNDELSIAEDGQRGSNAGREWTREIEQKGSQKDEEKGRMRDEIEKGVRQSEWKERKARA